MRAALPLAKGFSGLYTREAASRVTYNPETGISSLGYAVNVVVSDTGRISRRSGYKKVSSDPYRSLFPYSSYQFIAACEDELRLVNVYDFSYKVLFLVNSVSDIVYVRIGNSIVFTDNHLVGILKNEEAELLSVGIDYASPVFRNYSAPEGGSDLAYYANSLFIARGNTLWYTEPFSLNLINKESNFFTFGSNINMVESVSTGLYVSTEKRIRYIGGDTIRKFKETILTDYPAIKGTAVKTSGLVFNEQDKSPEELIIFTTKNGICIGGSDAVFGNILFKNLTQDKFDYPSGLRGSAVIIDNVYIVNIFN